MPESMPPTPQADSAEPNHPTTDDLKLELARTQERLAAVERERDALATRLQTLGDKADELQARYTSQQEALGRLRQIETVSDELRHERDNLRQERDGLRTELNQVHAAIPEQVRTQLSSQLGEVTQAHDEEVQALQADRERLQGRVTELEQTVSASQAPAITTSDLAGHFAEVLNDLGKRPPAAGESFAAALTGLKVQAKGLLRTNEQGGVEILTAQAGSAPAEQLSTVQMELKLLPWLQNPVPPNVSSAEEST
ncbi:hypothetical protein [Frankia sp. Cr2]|uniref:hypothetical protein n=1 Tax=Frankia sp. Cr2 TaxID=3073932 RepID=UPI002AD466A9|nr:hypothetical protein [Frankia sp. Cr2]